MSQSQGDTSSQKDSQTEQSKLNRDFQIETLESRLNKILIQAQQMISEQRFQDAVIKLSLLNEKINFLKQNDKQYDRKLQIISLYNLAAAYHKQWKLDTCIQVVEKFISLLKVILQQEENQSKSEFWYKMKMLLIKGQLQYCAVLSQLGNHQLAFRTLIEITDSLKHFFTKSYLEIDKFLKQLQKSNDRKCVSNSLNFDENFCKNDKIEFSANVLSKAKQILLELINLQTFDEVVKQNYKKICEQLIQLKSKTYFWKDNPENNIKLLKKELNQQRQHKPYANSQDNENSQRNLLGIKKPKSWLEQFTIAKVMVMSPANYLQFAQKDNLVYQFNQKNIIEKIILVSVTYFSLAIEIRFIEEVDRKKQEASSVNKDKSNLFPLNDSTQSKTKIKKSEVFHLKSIILLCQMVKGNSAFLNHLVTNYHKHYKQDLIPIEQECSIAEYSHIYDRRNSILYKDNEKNHTLNLDEQQIKQDFNRDMNFLKQSAYFQDEQVKRSIMKAAKKYYLMKSPIYEINKKKSLKKKPGFFLDSSEQVSNKYINSISLSRNLTNLMKSTRYTRYENKKQCSKDKTLKKISVGKMITFGSPIKLGLYQLKEKDNDKIDDKSISIGGVKLLRSQDKKSFSIRNFSSVSIGRSSMNSKTLRSKKRIHEKEGEKYKQKMKLSQLKESYELNVIDFKKKQKKIAVETYKIDKQKKDKRKQKLNSGLMLLKKATSNPNLIKKSSSLFSQYPQNKELTSIKQKSKKIINKK